MSHEHNNPTHPSDDTLVRLAADGELTDGLSPALDALRQRDPEFDARVSHERRLRDAVASALASDAPPAGLRDRVARAMASVPDAQIEGDEPLVTATVITTPASATRDRRFWARVPAALAVAATLALVASVLIVSLSVSHPLYENGVLGTQLVGFIESEHESCSEFTEHFQHKFITQSLEDARALSASYLGAPVHVLTFEPSTWAKADLEFMGFGPCAVPGADRSGHMIFRSITHPELTVSLFVHKDDGRLEFESANCCYVSNPASEDEGKVVAWRTAGMVYYLYTPSDESMEKARELLSTPENEHNLL